MPHGMILVIDDELETIELIQAAFKRRGRPVLGAMSGPESLFKKLRLIGFDSNYEADFACFEGFVLSGHRSTHG